MRTGVSRFGIFQLSFSTGELRKHGVPLRLSGHSLSILLLLVKRRGEIVTREEIQKQLWPANTDVDFQLGLNTAVKKLRAVLGDTPASPRYIETVAGVGYRFIAPVQEQGPAQNNGRRPEAEALNMPPESTPVPPVAAAPAVTSRARRKTDKLRKPVVIAAAVLLATAVGWKWLRPPAAPKVVQVKRLTTSSRVDAFGRIQSDGVRLFYLERRGANWVATQLPAAGGQSQALPVPFQNTKILDVSFDGSELLIAPFVSRADPLPLWIVSSVGGAPRRVGDVVALDAAFGPNAGQITYATQSGIFSVTPDGLNPRKLVDVAGPKSALAWSPDRRLLRFTVETERGPISSTAIWEVRADRNDAHPLLPGWREQPHECCGRWTADGKHYVFVARNKNGEQNLWELPTNRGTGQAIPIQLTIGPVTMDQPAPGRDSAQLFALGQNSSNQYALYDTNESALRTLLGGAPLASWISFAQSGNWMAWIGEDRGIWRGELDGRARREIVPPSFHPNVPRVSPDGSQIAFEGFPEKAGSWHIYLVSAEGGSPKTVPGDPECKGFLEWSPDGSKLLYSKMPTDSESDGLFTLDWRTGEKKKVTGSEGMGSAYWSPDGKFVVAVNARGTKYALFEWATGYWKGLGEGKVLGPAVWAGDSRSFYIQDVVGKGQEIRRVFLENLRIETLDACGRLLAEDVQRCGLEGAARDGSLLLRLTKGDYDLYAIEIGWP